ncbi:MAG: LLM class flavin-dependent oxidoreductase [Caldilineaceae bacterium]|nr:LLM class flavin-dependent oxidoreductase [Caldilineaceae bacterium]
MSSPFRLGFLTHLEGAEAPRKIYQETLELFVAADQLGFDVIWVAQHHFKERSGCLPSPFPFLAAAAERTRQLRLGTSIVILPLEHPLRVAEDAAVTDTLSDGRLELGVGSGGDAAEFQAFGIALDQRHTLTTTGLQQLQKALRGEAIGPNGQRLQPPAPTLAERLWQSALSARGAGYVAQQGVGLMLSRAAWGRDEPTDQVQLRVAQAYQEQWRNHPQPPRIGLSRGVYPAADRATALAELRTGVMQSAEMMAKQGNLPPGLSLEEYCQRMYIAYGHPEEVAATLAADRVLPMTTDLILQFNPVKPPLAQSIQMLEQIATQIAPALGWRSAPAS